MTSPTRISAERRRELLAEPSRSARDPFAEVLDLWASLADALQLGALHPLLARPAPAPVARRPRLQSVPTPAVATERAA